MEYRQIVGIAGVVLFAGVFRGWWDWLGLEEVWALGVVIGLMVLGFRLTWLRRGHRWSRG